MYPIPRNSLSQLQALGLYIHLCAFRNPCSTFVNNVNNPTYKLKKKPKKTTIESTPLVQVCFSASHQYRYEAAVDVEFANMKWLSKDEVPTWTSEAKKVKANHRHVKSTGNMNRSKKYLTAVLKQKPLNGFHFTSAAQARAGAAFKSRDFHILQTLHLLKLAFHCVSWNVASACSEMPSRI